MMNQLYQGDNLAILRSLPDASVDLVCTDPPFNTGKDWGAFDDRWEGGLDGYLKFMKPRLIECRRVLKDTGSLYLHCDPTASHYLKVMLDSVFGIKQFRNEIVWCYDRPSTSRVRQLARTHDTIYWYSKSDKWEFNLDEIRMPYSKETIARAKRANSGYNGCSKAILNPKGKSPNDWVCHIRYLQGNATENIKYPTQKPVALYERMIKASSNQSDIVLDPFAGSGTTLDAAESLGRKWIGIDIGDEAIEIIQTRLRDRHGLMLNYELIRS